MLENKMNISLLLLIFCTLFIFSCSNNNYRNIETLKKNYNLKNEKTGIVLSHKKFNPSKKVFENLNNDLTDDFIYIYCWVNHLPITTNHFQALIYDRKLNKQYYISNTLQDKNLVNLNDDSSKYMEEQLILKYYLDDKIDSLMSLSPPFISSEIGSQYSLFDPTLKNTFVIKNLILDNNGEIFK